MGFYYVYGKNRENILDHIVQVLENEGFRDIKVGEYYISFKNFAPCYKKRLGIFVNAVDALSLFLCDKHEENEKPEGIEHYSWFRFCNGIVLCCVNDEHISLFSLDILRRVDKEWFSHFGFYKVVDFDNNPIGLLVWDYHKVYYYSNGKIILDIYKPHCSYLRDQTLITAPIFIVYKNMILGKLKGILSGNGFRDGVAYNYKYGNEIYVLSRFYLFRIE